MRNNSRIKIFFLISLLKEKKFTSEFSEKLIVMNFIFYGH